MLCEKCKKNMATVHITKITKGVKQEVNLCEACAKESGELNMGVNMTFPGGFSFQNVLSGIMDYINQPIQSNTTEEMTCSSCGNTYSDFKNTGLLGCSECYKEFKDTLAPVIKRVQGNLEHSGKIPKKSGKGLAEKKRMLQLKEDLQKAIAAEEYEKAATIRDMIRELQKGE